MCGKVTRSARSLGGHLRHNKDEAHQEFAKEWRASYEVQVQCRKCGVVWVSTQKQEGNKKRCLKCQLLRETLSKRAYEALPTAKDRDAAKRRFNHPLKLQDDLQSKIGAAIEKGEPVQSILRQNAIPYKTFREIGERILGVEGYQNWASHKKSITGQRNIRSAHSKYAKLSPEDKALFFQRYRKASPLEKKLSEVLVGWDFRLNEWQSLPVLGRMVPREADIKISVGPEHKLVILCDGEAFHGPRAMFNPEERTRDDVVTAEAYFAAGYSVVRYSESEINQGWAADHLQRVLKRAVLGERIFRLWHLKLERWVGWRST